MDYSPPGSSVHGDPPDKMLEWVAMPSFRGSPQPREQNWVSCNSCIESGSFTTEPLGKLLLYTWPCKSPWAQHSSRFVLHESSARLKANTRKACYFWLSKGANSSERPCFLFEPEHASNTEIRQCHPKKHKRPRRHVVSFAVSVLPCISQPSMLEIMPQKKRERQDNPQSISFLSFLSHQ